MAQQVPVREADARIAFESVSKVFQCRSLRIPWIRSSKHATIALSNASFQVAKGEVLVLLGPNGSGKTTTLKLVSTMLLPDSGRVCVDGFDTGGDAQRVRARVGFAVATERSFFPRLTARENLAFFATLDDVPRRERRERVNEILDRVKLVGCADTLAVKFSSGMYQRLAIARALLKRPAVMLLDEPTRSLDPGSCADVWCLVREVANGGAAVLLTTHSFSEAAAVADSIAVLHHGTIVAHEHNHDASVTELKDLYFDAIAAPSPLICEEVAV